MTDERIDRLDVLIATVMCATLALGIHGCTDSTRYQSVPGPTRTVTVEAPPVTRDPVWPATFQVPVVPPGQWRRTLHGTEWWCPEYLTGPGVDAVALEIDTAPAERKDAIQQQWIPAGTAGAPRGWRVVVQDPGRFTCLASPTGVAQGFCDWVNDQAHVARAMEAPDSQGRYLPTLGHEYAHEAVWRATGDAALAGMAGH